MGHKLTIKPQFYDISQNSCDFNIKNRNCDIKKSLEFFYIKNNVDFCDIAAISSYQKSNCDN